MKTFRLELDNVLDAIFFTDMLDAEAIPYAIVEHGSHAYDGLFQMTMGWGYLEIPVAYQEQVLELYQIYKKPLREYH
ncbi:hypothetical protein SPSYN_02230 [Sporotomaculum syntrophicum]|uniref:DUF2007 domain-containing protein n=1 Tax=Sporotomaculum syntrophicum TaxID=182264 RepID=A0A9D2WP17_9FIRM|nr:hypothetical protein [Sporotomaculum syntrophicum]KAF1084453.1 hypothetical protein SPSYN_02230 [Sporotomaculum syntrophicum]